MDGGAYRSHLLANHAADNGAQLGTGPIFRACIQSLWIVKQNNLRARKGPEPE